MVCVECVERYSYLYLHMALFPPSPFAHKFLHIAQQPDVVVMISTCMCICVTDIDVCSTGEVPPPFPLSLVIIMLSEHTLKAIIIIFRPSLQSL